MLKLEFTVDETNVILVALKKLPMETVEKLVAKIITQATPQLEPKKESE